MIDTQPCPSSKERGPQVAQTIIAAYGGTTPDKVTPSNEMVYLGYLCMHKLHTFQHKVVARSANANSAPQMLSLRVVLLRSAPSSSKEGTRNRE
jgi:hypothetical protein